MNISKKYFSTGEVAEMLSVTSDTVLRWARAGKIPAIRTPGGHYRIKQKQLFSIINDKISHDEDQTSSHIFCWEFHLNSGNGQVGCQNCIVYRVQAVRCYEMAKLSADLGHAKLFCNNCCQECDYYKFINNN